MPIIIFMKKKTTAKATINHIHPEIDENNGCATLYICPTASVILGGSSITVLVAFAFKPKPNNPIRDKGKA